MSTRCPGALVLLIVLAAPACSEEAETAPARASATLAEPLPAGHHRTELATPRAACLTEAGGSGPLAAALRDAQSEVARHDGAAEAWTAVGQAWLAVAEAGEADAGFAAEGCLEVALSLEPKHLGALELEAALLMRQHRFALALERSEAILARDGGRLAALGIRCDALLELGRYDDAAAAADEAAALRPGPAMYARSALFAFLSGDREAAKIHMRSALMVGRNPKQPQATAWAFAEAARLFLNEGDYRGAEAVFREALEWVGEYPPALLGIGQALLAQERPDDALPFLERAARAGQVEAIWRQGDAHLLLGDDARAEALYRRFEAEAAHDRYLLALFFAVTGRDAERALELIDAESKTRGGIWLADVRAWALYRLGRHAEAQAAADEATQLGTEDPRLLYHAGAIALANGDPRGRAQIEQALALSPRFGPREATDAQALLGR